MQASKSPKSEQTAFKHVQNALRQSLKHEKERVSLMERNIKVLKTELNAQVALTKGRPKEDDHRGNFADCRKGSTKQKKETVQRPHTKSTST